MGGSCRSRCGTKSPCIGEPKRGECCALLCWELGYCCCWFKSEAVMETQTEVQQPCNGQLISVPHKDTIRLLEVYVKRSLSLTDGRLGERRAQRKEKWVTIPTRQRRHSSDSFLHLSLSKDDELRRFYAVEPLTDFSQTLPKEEKTHKKLKNKKSSFWKSFFGIFSRKGSKVKDEEDDDLSEIPDVSKAEAASACPPTPAVSQKRIPSRKKSLKRRLSKRLSTTKLNRLGKDLNQTDITKVEAVSVEPTYAYYEKVSEELEKIIHEVKDKVEVKPLSDEEIIERIIALTKEQGDAIDIKMKDNPTLSNFFQRMPYSSFQTLADAYLKEEALQTQNSPAVPPTAPELVKLAFTYDFTAKIARLSKQNVGHITGLGNRYLQDRFEYKQAMTDHPVSDSDG